MNKKFIKSIALILVFSFIFQQSLPAGRQTAFAQLAGELDISSHLALFRNSLVSDKFRPLHLRFLQYLPQENSFKLLLDKGDQFKKGTVPVFRGLSPFSADSLETSTKTLLNYFFIGLSLPNDSFWVNLRPDAEDNIIDDYLAKTDVGKVLLEADL